MDAKLLKPTTDAELEKYCSREEVLVSRGRKEVAEWLRDNNVLCQHNQPHAYQFVDYCGDDGIAHREPKLVCDEFCLRCKWQAKKKKWGID